MPGNSSTDPFFSLWLLVLFFHLLYQTSKPFFRDINDTLSREILPILFGIMAMMGLVDYGFVWIYKITLLIMIFLGMFAIFLSSFEIAVLSKSRKIYIMTIVIFIFCTIFDFIYILQNVNLLNLSPEYKNLVSLIQVICLLIGGYSAAKENYKMQRESDTISKRLFHNPRTISYIFAAGVAIALMVSTQINPAFIVIQDTSCLAGWILGFIKS